MDKLPLGAADTSPGTLVCTPAAVHVGGASGWPRARRFVRVARQGPSSPRVRWPETEISISVSQCFFFSLSGELKGHCLIYLTCKKRGGITAVTSITCQLPAIYSACLPTEIPESKRCSPFLHGAGRPPIIKTGSSSTAAPRNTCSGPEKNWEVGSRWIRRSGQ